MKYQKSDFYIPILEIISQGYTKKQNIINELCNKLDISAEEKTEKSRGGEGTTYTFGNLYINARRHLRNVSLIDENGNITEKGKEYLKDPELHKDYIKSNRINKKKEKVMDLDDLYGEINHNKHNSLTWEIKKNNPFFDDVYITDEEYNTITNLLQRKKNIILQGAPGIGKTFCVRRLCYSLMGKKDDENDKRITMIQFHQNYTYEDFVMGYKPDGNGFILKEGVFYKLCKQAEENPDNNYYLIIDEINRGNLSKIFGELLMLIEKDYRGKEHQIKLAYSDELFSVPENLFIIGMMNTADRSLAMIDYALRRRFSFFDMKPAFENSKFIAYQKSLEWSQFDKVINAVKELNKRIAKDESMGEGFMIGHSYFCNAEKDMTWLNAVVKYDIEPMLREYWFDDVKRAEEECSKLEDALK